jgi:Erg28 like protein
MQVHANNITVSICHTRANQLNHGSIGRLSTNGRRVLAQMAPSRKPKATSGLASASDNTQISAVSVANSVQAYLQPTYPQRVYTGTDTTKPSPVNALSSRTFGTWTLLSSVIRFYAAYNITDPVLYQITCWTYIIAFGHFLSELLVFKSTSLSPGFIAPMLVASGTLTWMLLQKDFYVS